MSFDSDSSLSMDDVVWAMFIFGGQRNAFFASPSFFSLEIVTGRVHTRLLPHQPNLCYRQAACVRVLITLFPQVVNCAPKMSTLCVSCYLDELL
jgi:hypothetical protein